MGAPLVCVDDRLLHLIQHPDGLFHVVVVSEGHGRRVVDHHHGSRSHKNLVSGHCDNGCSGCGDPVYFDGDLARILAEHRVDLACSNHVSARAVDPYRHRTGSCHQIAPEHVGSDIVIEP